MVMVLSTFGIGTQLLITNLILSNFKFIDMMAQSASIGHLDCLHAQQKSLLVQELNGAHLRLAIAVVS